MLDFLLFRRMLIPVIIQLIFWLFTAVCIVVSAIDFMRGTYSQALSILILGPIIIRISCELLVVPFRINDTLTDIKNELQTPFRQQPKS